MPYRCQKCMNTFKTLSMYNKHAVDCKKVKPQQQQYQQQQQQRQGVVVKRTIGDTGYNNISRRTLNGKVEVRTIRSSHSNNDDDIVILDGGKDSKVGVKQEIVRPLQTVVQRNSPTLKINPGNIGPKLYRCHECDSAFDTKPNLETHIQENHSDSFCEECEDDFTWPDENHDCYYTRYQLRYISGDIVPAF